MKKLETNADNIAQSRQLGHSTAWPNHGATVAVVPGALGVIEEGLAMDLRRPNPILAYRMEGDTLLKGIAHKVIIRQGGYIVVDLVVFEDTRVHCWHLMSYEEFLECIQSGWIRTDVPEDSTITIDGLAVINHSTPSLVKTTDELIKEVEDSLKELRGGKSRITELYEAIEGFFLNSSEENYQRLFNTYHNLPSYRTDILLEMDSRKDPMKQIIASKEDWVGQDLTGWWKMYFE